MRIDSRTCVCIVLAMSSLPRVPPAPVRHRLKRLARPLVAPAVFDFWAGKLNPLWTWERPLARVVTRRVAARGAVTLELEPNGHWQGCLPGQHVNISAEVDGQRITRSYSPDRVGDGRIAITIKAIEGGRLSPRLQCAQVGDLLEVGPAFGTMTLPPRPEGAWLFLAAGSGITPLMAMTRALAAQGMPVPLTLAYWARNREEACFVDELEALAAAHPRFTLHLLTTREAAAGGDPAGRIDGALLERLVDGLDGRHVYACGPGGFVRSAQALLEPRVRAFHGEAFTALPRVRHDTGLVQLNLLASGRTVKVARGQPLLEALEAHGIKPPSGCRMGLCNTCACGKRSGGTRHLPTGVEAHEPASSLKLCIHSATTDLDLDL